MRPGGEGPAAFLRLREETIARPRYGLRVALRARPGGRPAEIFTECREAYL